uniref:Uncharacterized protein n=1 Tax=Anguilla anguilla TaxID=7936 RepID=A0A0E9QRB1_ANGAN
MQLSPPPGQTQNQPYLLFSMASRKYLQTICVFAFFLSASPCFLFTTSSSFFSSQLSMVSFSNSSSLPSK